MDREGF